MSQMPPEMPSSMRPDEPFDPNAGGSYMSYNKPAKTSGMALTAMILGILAIPLGCFGVGIVLGIVAMIMGIISLNAINRNPEQQGGKGYAITGIVTGALSLVLVVPLLIAILLPSLGKARELSNRSVCAANVRGLTQSMLVYAADNEDRYPLVAGRGGYGLAAAGSGVPGATSEETINSMYKGAPSPSVTQNVWLLVVNGEVSSKQFLCKSDPGAKTPASPLMGGNFATNFNDGKGPSDMTYSYAFAYPWTTAPGRDSTGKAVPAGVAGEWWKDTMDAGVPILGDMGPVEGTGTPAATTNGMAREENSFTHQRDGQNVGFGDAHAEFTRVAAAGEGNDNIYTGGHGKPSAMGAQAAGREPDVGTGGVMGTFDVCLVPAADGNAGYMRK